MTEKTQQSSLLGKIAAYTEILAKDPTSTIFVSLSEAYRKMGMLDDARKVIENGLQSHSDFSPAHIVKARILCQQGEYQESETSFKKALELDSASLAGLVGYARLCILLGEEEKARPFLLDARELSPADPVINKLLLSLPEPQVVEEPVSLEVEQYENAVEPEIDGSAESFPAECEEEREEAQDQERFETPPLASTTLADLYLRQGLTDQALEMYRQLLADDPDNLELRRKIRDIEEPPPEPARNQAPPIEKEEPVEPSAFELHQSEAVPFSGDNVVLEEKTECATDIVDNSLQCSGKDSDDKVLTTLNRWLDSIKKRRGDV